MDNKKSFGVKSSTNKNAYFVSVVRKIRGYSFFEIMMQGSPLAEYVLRDDDGLSKVRMYQR